MIDTQAIKSLAEHCARQAFLIEADCIDSGQTIDALSQAATALTDLLAERGVTRAALEPFAQVADHSGGAWHDERRLSELACPNNLTIGDCRRARQALGGTDDK